MSSKLVNSHKTIVLEGNLTFDYNEMLNELSSQNHCLFGDIKNVIIKIKNKGGDKLTFEQVTHLVANGTNMDFYDENNIRCYLCVCPRTFANYMFPPMESENRDNDFARIRGGVSFFYNKGFEIYIIPSS